MSPDDPVNPPAADDPLWDEAVDADDKNTRGVVTEFVRRMAVAGLGALFMTEEGIRSLGGQLKLPKEVLHFILSQADRTKNELGRVVSEEVRRFLQSDRLREEFLKLLAGMTVEVKAEVRLVPDKTIVAPTSDEKPKDDGAAAAAEPVPPASGPRVVITELHTRRGSKKKE